MARFVAVGLVAGFISGMFGVGGGLIMVPLLILVAHLDQRQASATSLFAIVPTATVGAIGYAVKAEVAWLPALLVAVGGMGGSLLGARLLRRIAVKKVTWGFVGLQVATALVMLFYVPQRAASLGTGPGIWIGLVALGLVMGLCAGLFGVGGGIIAVPALMGIFGAGDLLARGTSLVVMVPTAITGTVSNWRHGLVQVPAALATGLSAMASSWAGTWAAAAVSPKVGNLAFAGILAIGAWQLSRKNLRRS
ncbi:MAG: sulfite exporter TauE/SafE family protein [Micrococcales bacterium]|nr:sulfite exporter TauE/SafE family protein [Micrococcales bacterium]